VHDNNFVVSLVSRGCEKTFKLDRMFPVTFDNITAQRERRSERSFVWWYWLQNSYNRRQRFTTWIYFRF